MTITTQKSRKGKSKPLSSALLIAAIPMAFLAGLFVGFQLWGEAPKEQTVDIPIYDDDPTLGPEDAAVTIVEFSDYQCPYCQRYHLETFSQIMDVYGDQIRYVFKDLPLTSIHPNALPAAVAAHCADAQGAFWEYHTMLFSGELQLGRETYLAYANRLGLDIDQFEACLDSGRFERIVMEDTDILTSLGAPISTPTFFINDKYLAGAQPFSEFARLIEAELDAAN